MALALLPIAFFIGLALADRRLATRASLALGLAALAGLLVAKIAGAGVSPWEALALVICLAPAVLLTRFGARLRHR
jgi:hypothetical protein